MSRTTPARERSPKARPSAAGWARFQRNLTAVLDGLAPEQFLVVSSKRGNRFVQFVKSPPKKGASELRAEAVSNAYLGKSRRLGARQLAALAKLGWKSPTRAPGEQRDPAGSPNFFRDFAVPFPSARIARMAVRTLANVLGVRHPRDLEYRCFQEPGGTDVLVPILGISPLRPKAQEEPSFASTRDRILLALKEASKIDDLAYDEDGDIPVRYGEARLEDGAATTASRPALLH